MCLLLVPCVQATPITFTNPASITIPYVGAANPYPSSILVSGVTTAPTNVTVDLFSLGHTWPDDIHVLLVGPTGATTYLMGRVGGSTDVSGINLRFDDSGTQMPDPSPLVSGTYQPTLYGSEEDFSSHGGGAPAPPYGSQLAVFNGLDPNGSWDLFVLDEWVDDRGVISGGWALTLEVVQAVPEPSTFGLVTAGLAGLLLWRRRRPA